MKKLPIILCVLAAVGCTSARDQGRTAADTWHIGKALEVGNSDIPKPDLILMGRTLQSIADRWAEELDVQIDKTPGVLP